MKYMFSDCSSLTRINVTNFDTQNILNMGNIFSQCVSFHLKIEPDVYYLNTSNVINMKSKFKGCSSINSLYIEAFDISDV